MEWAFFVEHACSADKKRKHEEESASTEQKGINNDSNKKKQKIKAVGTETDDKEQVRKIPTTSAHNPQPSMNIGRFDGWMERLEQGFFWWRSTTKEQIHASSRCKEIHS
jgi:hypothetical protein